MYFLFPLSPLTFSHLLQKCFLQEVYCLNWDNRYLSLTISHLMSQYN
ncbi:hypothetical protein FDUTEX481_09906 [Tolypothrix sp. PCC 7601]|nr:hypothetical protein FDUTEX481_09906 [Tolypothrix sp. PCC 7601]